MIEETDEMRDVNKRIRKCVVNIVSSFNKERNELNTWDQYVQIFLSNYEKDSKEFAEHRSTINIKYNDEKLKSDSIHKILDEKINELKRSKTELNGLETKYKLLLKELERVQQECDKTKKKSGYTKVDRTILDLSRKKIELYGQMSNIMWDYSQPLMSESIIGYARNKETNYIHAFEFKKNEMSSAKLEENLWNEMEQGSTKIYDDIVAMTRVMEIPPADILK